MTLLDAELDRRLTAIRGQNLLRQLRRVDTPQDSHLTIEGRPFLNFSSNDYLGLANHPALKEAGIKAIEKFGSGAGASRLISGSLAPFHDLEATLAAFKQTEAALTFATGFATALGTIPALVGAGDIIVVDRLVHASIVDAAKLSGAKLRVFAHNDLEDLASILKWATARISASSPHHQILIVTESIFSMDGDAAPLREIVALKNKYGAWLMVDEAHSTGLYGENLGGLAQHFGIGDQIEIQMGTLGKAIGASGGYICGSRRLIDFLINRARSFIFSTAPTPAPAAAAQAGIELIRSPEGKKLSEQLWQNVDRFKRETHTSTRDLQSANIPILIGNEAKAMEAANRLQEQSFFVPAIRYPTVARNAARLRVTLSASHTADDISQLVAALKSIGL